jgi:hypothetical protein
VAFFRRSVQPTRGPAPHMPPRERRRLIRESDRQNYTSHGYRALTSYAFAKDIIPGKLVGLIHDQLTEGGGTPERSAVWVGVHDVDLGRGVAAVMGEKYSSAGATLGQFLPLQGDHSMEGRQLKGVLLFWDDGERQERHRVERVVALAQQFAVRFTTVEQVRLAVVDQLSRERLPTGRRVKLALAAAWCGHHDVAENMTVALAAELEAPALERLRELQSHRPRVIKVRRAGA